MVHPIVTTLILTPSHNMERRIENARLRAAARALDARNEEMVYDTGIAEARSQRDECWMLLMKVLHPNAEAPFTFNDIEKLTLRNGVPLLMLPNGWNRVNEIAVSQYGLRGECTHNQNWELRPEFAGVYVWDLSERELGRQIETILVNWDPKNLMNSWEANEFYRDVADLQEAMVYKTVAERVGILGSQIDACMKAKIEEVVPIIQSYLRAGEPDPFKVAEIQKAITELRGDPFAMDAMRLLVEELGSGTKDEFGINQLTAILGELNVAGAPRIVDDCGPVAAESDGSYDTEAESGSDNTSVVAQGETVGATCRPTMFFRGQ
ncbi:hypothetical protein BLS_009136 [Venturia inaequalis]|uniref:Uncharacterized protein n=1 Tax=Venturia inaequalis TaxID=5025 RepID=A0A8H3YL04_VENIN|nr:hypothetical protein BLS_009136 [Venturia inaequalis]